VFPKPKKRRMDDPTQCIVAKAAAVLQAEERHKRDSDEDESGVWVDTVQG
jgi:hypothetical protein